MNVIRPPLYIRHMFERNINPLIFLAGPIMGSDDWQAKAEEIIHSIDKNITIANPRRVDLKDSSFNLDNQIDWEVHHMDCAAYSGAILFWLAKETTHLCKRAYAQTTRFELGEWISRCEYNKNAKIVIGIEDGFPGSDYIKHRLKHYNIYDNLEETCKAAIEYSY